MRKHIQILGILNLVWGSFGAVAALVVLLVFGGILGVIGIAAGHDPDASIAAPIVGLVGGAIFLLLLITSVPSIVAGIGLLRFAPWARILGIVLSALHLVNVPLGTALGIYGLWVLLSDETASVFSPPRSPIRI